MTPVVYKIQFEGDVGLFKMTSNYSAYDEDETLIQDGLEYKVIEIKTIYDEFYSEAI